MSRRFQFSLKAMLVVLTVACVWLGTFVNQVRRQREAVAVVERLGALPYHSYEWNDARNWFHLGAVHEPGPAWVRNLVGIEWLDTVVAVRFDMAPLSDTDLIWLIERLPKLRYLELSHAAVGDRALSKIDALRNLRNLEISHTQITDRALASIGRVRSLRSLDLGGTRITDQGLSSLHGLTGLRSIYLESTGVTIEGMAALKNALPEVKRRRY